MPARSFDEIADELYGLPLGEFIAARTRDEKQARQDGDRELAAAIRALAKPNVAAWLANQLARAHRAELESLLELGAGMREATRRLAGDELRALTRQQQESVHSLMHQVRWIAGTHRQPMSDNTVRGLLDTLHAAVVDEQVAQQLLAGRLTDAVFRSGFDHADDAAPAAWPTEPAPRRSDDLQLRRAAKARADAGDPAPAAGGAEPAPHRGDDLKLRRAEKALADAEAALSDAVAARDEARGHAAEGDRAAAAAEHRVAELGRQLAAAEAAATEADRHRDGLAAALAEAEKSLDAAERRRADALAQRDRAADNEPG